MAGVVCLVGGGVNNGPSLVSSSNIKIPSALSFAEAMFVCGSSGVGVSLCEGSVVMGLLRREIVGGVVSRPMRFILRDFARGKVTRCAT